MGLDAYVYDLDPKDWDEGTMFVRAADCRFDSYSPEGAAMSELAYWRKRWDLQNWMETLYRSRGGQQDFAGIYLRLEPQDLQALDLALRLASAQHMKHAAHFSVDESALAAQRFKQDRRFIKKAQAALKAGRILAYYASW